MKTLIVGDIHGCYAEFQELLATSGLGQEDAIITLGDMIDRGPETPQVLDFFRRQPNARSLMGNHERNHVRAARGEEKLALSQVIARGQIDAGYDGGYRAALNFMDTLPAYLELPEAILVHAYLEPGIALEQQSATVLCGTMGGERHLSARLDRPWYELYDAEKPVIVGHKDYLHTGQPLVYLERVFGLDTSCVLGKRLTGLLLPGFKIISVASRADHWYFVRKQYRQQHPVARPRELESAPVSAPAWDEESERLLEQMIDMAARENQRLVARLGADPAFENLNPRQQAKAYTAEVAGQPLAVLLNLARTGALDPASARKALRTPALALFIAKRAGLR